MSRVSGQRLYLTVSVLDGQKPMGVGGEIFQRRMISPWCPSRGQRLVVIPHSLSTPDDGYMLTVHETWWAFDGAVHVEFERIVVDPNEERYARILSEALHGSVHRRETCWWTKTDGLIEDSLLAVGWTRYLA